MDYPIEMKDLIVNVTIEGIRIREAKKLIENHFGNLPWPQATGGEMEVVNKNGIKITVKAG